MVFISYSRKDRDAAKSLHRQLKAAGYDLWFDEDNLLPGQNWELEIQNAIKRCSAVVVCLSSKWVNERGYVQKELKITLDVLSEIPEGKVFVIPIKFDDCETPSALSKLHWISYFEPEGLNRLRKAIDTAVETTSTKVAKTASTSVSPWHEFVEDTIAKGGLIHADPWASGSSQEEVDFKKVLKGRMATGFDLFDVGDWMGILDLWQPLLGNPFFRVEHPEWQDKPYFRCQIHTAKSQLFYARVQLGQKGGFREHLPVAFALLGELLRGNPYSLKGGSYDRLPTETAQTQNLNYRDTLHFALNWYSGWERQGFQTLGIKDDDVQAVKSRIEDRLSEIDFMLQRSSDEPK